MKNKKVFWVMSAIIIVVLLFSNKQVEKYYGTFQHRYFNSNAAAKNSYDINIRTLFEISFGFAGKTLVNLCIPDSIYKEKINRKWACRNQQEALSREGRGRFRE